MYFDRKLGSYILIAIVEGAIRDCGDIDFPGIYVRLDHPSIWNFIDSSLKPKSNGKF
jgi:hypothetical protein